MFVLFCILGKTLEKDVCNIETSRVNKQNEDQRLFCPDNWYYHESRKLFISTAAKPEKCLSKF